jgi:hypothetical protein
VCSRPRILNFISLDPCVIHPFIAVYLQQLTSRVAIQRLNSQLSCGWAWQGSRFGWLRGLLSGVHANEKISNTMVDTSAFLSRSFGLVVEVAGSMRACSPFSQVVDRFSLSSTWRKEIGHSNRHYEGAWSSGLFTSFCSRGARFHPYTRHVFKIFTGLVTCRTLQ